MESSRPELLTNFLAHASATGRQLLESPVSRRHTPGTYSFELRMKCCLRIRRHFQGAMVPFALFFGPGLITRFLPSKE